MEKNRQRRAQQGGPHVRPTLAHGALLARECNWWRNTGHSVCESRVLGGSGEPYIDTGRLETAVAASCAFDRGDQECCPGLPAGGGRGPGRGLWRGGNPRRQWVSH